MGVSIGCESSSWRFLRGCEGFGINVLGTLVIEIEARTWAQFFLKWVIGHPTITTVTPATSSADHMQDNLAGGRGPLPDAALRARMAAFIDALPGGR